MVQLPAAALIFRSKGPQVAVIGSNDIVHFRPITIARDDGDVVEIEAELSPGDRVALNISDAVADGEKVSVAGSTSKAVAATGPPSASGERVVHDADQAASLRINILMRYLPRERELADLPQAVPANDGHYASTTRGCDKRRRSGK